MQSMRTKIFQAFDTSMPVQDRHRLAGRAQELARLTEAVLEDHKHAIIFGARGSGKTSLVRAFGDLADERNNIAIYNSCGGESTFSDLFRPFLVELAHLNAAIQHAPGFRDMAQGDFDARAFAMLLAEFVHEPTVLIIDEFDRISDERTKHEVASLLKLLSDTRSAVRFAIVGIAANMDDLFEGHPSLRRHLTPLQIKSIAPAGQHELLNLCCQRAGIDVSESAAARLVSAAIGSPFHLRLFGLNAALAAEGAGMDRIEDRHVETGLSESLAQWAEFAPDVTVRIHDMVQARPHLAAGIASAVILAAYSTVISRQSVSHALMRVTGSGHAEVEPAVDFAFQALMPLLRPTSVEGSYMFVDSLAPHFLSLICNGVALPSTAQNEADAFIDSSIRNSMGHRTAS